MGRKEQRFYRIGDTHCAFIGLVGAWSPFGLSFCLFMVSLFRLFLFSFAFFTMPLLAIEKLQFNRDVRPILSDKCFFCHGADAEHRKGNLRLDEQVSAFKPAKSGEIAIVPGKPDQSALLSRISLHEEDDDVMPTKKSGKTLSTREKSLLKQWISEGAEYQGHWAFTKPMAPVI